MSKFKEGDKVRCVSEYGALEEGEVYAVKRVNPCFVYVGTPSGGWCPERFELVERVDEEKDELREEIKALKGKIECLEKRLEGTKRSRLVWKNKAERFAEAYAEEIERRDCGIDDDVMDALLVLIDRLR